MPLLTNNLILFITIWYSIITQSIPCCDCHNDDNNNNNNNDDDEDDDRKKKIDFDFYYYSLIKKIKTLKQIYRHDYIILKIIKSN